jgi:histidyl-tRNA synthetase
MAGAGYIKAPKGTKDVVPAQIYKWHYVEGVLRETAREFGFHEIRFPVFEHTELFNRGIGDTTDVVQKEMYTFEDKGGRSITLRPEGTASTVRAYLENSLYAGTLPFKAYYIVPNFRYEKPQAGRLREHHQFGVECFGAAAPSADAEVISLADTFLKRLGIRNVTVHLNSIGCPDCRPKYHQALKEYFADRKDKLCDTCLDRLDRNPMRILDCKCPECQEVAKGAPVAIDYLCDDCREHFEKVKNYLTDMEIPFEIDTGIVRGLDYYSKTVFEFVSNDIGAQGTICGGGRYDGLVEQLGGPKTPGLGFGCGLERLLLVMESVGAEIPQEAKPDLYLANLGENADKLVQKLTHQLRLLGLQVERDIVGRGLKPQMKYADKIGAKYSAVIGDGEIESGKIRLKNMETGEQSEIALDAQAIAQAIQK